MCSFWGTFGARVARIALHTLGCKLNFSETAQLARQLVAAGHSLVEWDGPAEVYVLNTCTVTQQAERKAHKLLRQVRRRAPGALVVVTGCYAQLRPEAIAQEPGVALVATNAQKPYLAQAITDLLSAKPVQLPEPARWSFCLRLLGKGAPEPSSKYRMGATISAAFAQCPKRGDRAVARPPDQALQEALRLAEAGFAEIVLTGINLGDYGKPHGTDFLTLLKTLEAQVPPSVKRFRLSSIEPNLLSDAILDFVAAHSRWAPHFHLPLQSGSDRILALMRRRYRRALYERRIEAIRKRFPLAGIGVDVIVGFPGETAADFAESRRFLADLPVSYLHVFPYSERPGTVAATLPDSVPWPERLARSETLRELSARKRRSFAEQCTGATLSVLLENATEGLAENYLRLQLSTPHQPGALVSVQVGHTALPTEEWSYVPPFTPEAP